MQQKHGYNNSTPKQKADIEQNKIWSHKQRWEWQNMQKYSRNYNQKSKPGMAEACVQNGRGKNTKTSERKIWRADVSENDPQGDGMMRWKKI